jgi:protein ImuB
MGATAPPAERPLVTAMRDGQQRVVAAVDANARALGLSPGQPLSQATARVPDLAVLPAEPLADLAGLDELALWCVKRYTPIAASDPPDGLWLDITGCAHLWRGERPLLEDLGQRLAAVGIAARIVVADTPGAAHALARYGRQPLAVVPPGETEVALAPLPVAGLRLDGTVLDGLRRLGFERIGALLETPRAPLLTRFGTALGRRLDQAAGRVAEAIEPLRPASMIAARRVFAEPIATAEGLAGTIAALLEEICRELETCSQGARRLDLVCTRVDDSRQAIRIGTARPSRDPAHLGRLLREQIETIDPGFGIEVMSLSVPLAEPLTLHQLHALDATPVAPDLAPLVDVIANRLGAQRVYRAVPVESDLPERMVGRIGPLSPPRRTRWPEGLLYPSRLLAPPEPVDVIAVLPDHPPAQFVWRRDRHLVKRADGPQRIYGEWWRDDAETWAVRDYFQVEDEAGQRFWLFRAGDGTDPATGNLRWYLHGLFG